MLLCIIMTIAGEGGIIPLFKKISSNLEFFVTMGRKVKAYFYEMTGGNFRL